jgi:class 3 adenylate cyclase/DNA-binding CsgD family transcriptional regulator
MPSATLPSGTVTFAFSDIEGSTALLKELGAPVYGELLERHNELVCSALGGAGGIEIGRQGDSFFFVFGSAAAAIEGAVETQRALAREKWRDGAQIRVRMGLHTGEATLSGEGYVGIAVHQAARVGAVGHGGQVLLSRTTADVAASSLPADVELLELGAARLRGLDRPEILYQLVIEGLPSRFPPLSRPDAALATLSDGPPLLEREAELAAIQAFVESARSGVGRLLAIEARPGMGKTRLVTEARAVAAAAGFDVLGARGGELEHEFAYGIVRQLFEPVLARPDDRVELLSGAAELAATLFDESKLAYALGQDADVSFAMLHGLYWLAANAALRRPTLLAIDDLQWADAPSLRWLSYLVRRLEGLPLLVIAGTRPPEQSRETETLTELLADPTTVIVRPSALSVDAVVELARQSFGQEPELVFARACHDTTGGNPLFVRALLDTLAAERIEPTAAQAARVREIGPEAVSRAVALRLSRLPDGAATLARSLAILGDGTQLDHAAALAGLEGVAASDAVTALARADLLRLETSLEFVHPVVRAAVYERIPPSERPLEHRRAAAVLAGRGCAPEQVAAHLLLTPPAGDDAVVGTLREAAARALRSGAPEAAVEYLLRALDESTAAESRTAVLIDLGFAERRLDTAAAAAHLGQAIEGVADPRRRAEVALEWGRCLMRSNEHRQAVPVYRDEIARLGDSEPALRDLLVGELVSASWWEPELNPIAIETITSVDIEALAPGMGRDVLTSELGYYEARHGTNRERAAELARASWTPRLIESEGTVALFYTGFTFTVAGYTDDAKRFFAESLAAARRRGDLVTVVGLLVFRGLLETELGDLAAADTDLAEAHEIGLLSRMQAALPYHTSFWADVLIELGRLDEAESLLAASGFDGELPESAHVFFVRRARGRLRLAQHDLVGAVTEFLALGDSMALYSSYNPAFLAWRSLAAPALSALGRQEDALALAREELGLARAWGAPRTVGIALRALGLVEGGRSGEKLLREAVEVLAASPAHLEHARSLVELGAALRRGNRRSDARNFLRQGLELAHRCGAAPLAERAQAELAATGARPRRLVLSGIDALTPSERRVAQLAADNLTNKEIAQALFVTTKTVEVHLSNVYRKLEIPSRAQLGKALALGEPAAALA